MAESERSNNATPDKFVVGSEIFTVTRTQERLLVKCDEDARAATSRIDFDTRTILVSDLGDRDELVRVSCRAVAHAWQEAIAEGNGLELNGAEIPICGETWTIEEVTTPTSQYNPPIDWQRRRIRVWRLAIPAVRWWAMLQHSIEVAHELGRRQR